MFIHFDASFAPILLMTKSHFLDQILTQLQAEFAIQTKAAQLAHDEATSEESRPQSKYDTHGQEAAYLAEGQARLAGEASESIKAYQSCDFPDYQPTDPISIGALVAISSSEQTTRFLLGPKAGGLELTDLQNNPVNLITPQSPLGRQLIGKRVGDSVSLPAKVSSIQTITDVQ